MHVARAPGATRSGGQAAGAGAEDSGVSGGKMGWSFVFTNFLNSYYGNIYVPRRDVRKFREI